MTGAFFRFIQKYSYEQKISGKRLPDRMILFG